MKNFKIEIKTNPRDEWEKYKVFSDVEIAKQSLKTLRKNVPNLFKNSDYYHYRLINKITNEIIL